MALRLADRWIWDFWLVDHDGQHHCFYLQAPRSLGNPDLRHWNVSIGHAVSPDLRHWTQLPDALAPGAPGSWDDASTWTGSIIRHAGRWHLLYTGTHRAEEGLVQRVGLATSEDLVTWERHDGPVLEADPRWYETLDRTAWFDQAWRDPWVVEAPGGGFHAYVTARAREGEPDGRGVVGLAWSADLVRWECRPPVTEPMGFGQMEVPQLLEADGRSWLLFSSDTPTQGARLREAGLGTGTFCLAGAGPLGPFDPATLHAVEADLAGTTYAGRVHGALDDLRFLAWERVDAEGGFVGAITPPRRVRIGADGRLSLEPGSATALDAPEVARA